MFIMNKLCIVLILFILFSSCDAPKLHEKKLNVHIHFINKINSDKFDAKEGIFYSIAPKYGKYLSSRLIGMKD